MWWPDVQFILYAWNRLKWRKLLLFNYDSWNHYIKIKHSRRKAYMLCGQSCYIWAVEVVNGLLWRKMIRDLYQGTARALDWGVPWSFEIHSSFLWTAHVDDTPSPFFGSSPEWRSCCVHDVRGATSRQTRSPTGARPIIPRVKILYPLSST